MKINKDGLIKAAGLIGTTMTIGATLLNSYAGKKEQEAIIDKKVNEALSKRLKGSNDSQ
ncbi:MAG: hypothetical protein ACRCTZ_09400 [Sarcina sp.]